MKKSAKKSTKKSERSSSELAILQFQELLNLYKLSITSTVFIIEYEYDKQGNEPDNIKMIYHSAKAMKLNVKHVYISDKIGSLHFEIKG